MTHSARAPALTPEAVALQWRQAHKRLNEATLCPRLCRLFEALYGTDRSLPRNSGLTNIFADDPLPHELVDDFIAWRWPELMAPPADGLQIPGVYIAAEASETSPLRPSHAEELARQSDRMTAHLTWVLLRAERFMRQSVSNLQHLRDVSMDGKGVPSQVALDWLVYAQNLGVDVAHLFVDNTALVDRLIAQGVSLPPALNKFLQVLAHIRASRFAWSRRTVDYWVWPTWDEPVYCGEWRREFAGLDIVHELEEVQELLAKQASGDDTKWQRNYQQVAEILIGTAGARNGVHALHMRFESNPSAYKEKPGAAQIDRWPEFNRHLSGLTNYLNHHACRGGSRYFLKLEYGLQRGHYADMLLFTKERSQEKRLKLLTALSDIWINEITHAQGRCWSFNKINSSRFNRSFEQSYRASKGHGNDEASRIAAILVKHDLPFNYPHPQGSRRFRPGPPNRKA